MNTKKLVVEFYSYKPTVPPRLIGFKADAADKGLLVLSGGTKWWAFAIILERPNKR